MRHRRMCVLMILLGLCLAACSGPGKGSQAEQLVQEIRGAYLEMDACTAQMEVTADYGQRVYTYSMALDWQREEETVLTVTAPEEIAGVTAHIRAGETALEYDGVRVETGALNEEGLSPVDAGPALLRYAREGFVAACCLEPLGEIQALRIDCREPEGTAGVGLEATLWFDPEDCALLRGELSQDGFTVIQCEFSGFTYQRAAGAEPSE